MRKLEYIVVHTTGTVDEDDKVVHPTFESVRHTHMAFRGFRDFGYHYFIGPDGMTTLGRPLDMPGAHVKGFNGNSVGIVVTGHGDYESFNAAQTQALVSTCVHLCRGEGIPSWNVIGHRETHRHGGAPPTSKTCPGKLVDMDRIRRLVVEGLGIPSQNQTPKTPKTLEDRVARLEKAVTKLQLGALERLSVKWGPNNKEQE